MDINLHNYESWMFSYIDGELDSADKETLLNFIREHPSLQEELKVLQSVKFKPDTSIIFEDKKLLYHRSKTVVIKFWRIGAAAAALVLLMLITELGHFLRPQLKKQAITATPINSKKLSHSLAQQRIQPLKKHSPLPELMVPQAILHPVSGGAVSSARRSRAIAHIFLKHAIARDHAISGDDTVEGLSAGGNADFAELAPIHPVLSFNPPDTPSDSSMKLPRISLSSTAGNSKVIASFNGSAASTLIESVAKLQRFFSRKNPVLARTDVIQIGKYEFIKPK
jgi:hypothetical protein